MGSLFTAWHKFGLRNQKTAPKPICCIKIDTLRSYFLLQAKLHH